MKFIECLASYVPGLIVDRLIKDCDNHQTPVVPWRQEYETVCVFCDVSGFTALSEAMALNGKGAEGLAKHLNSYFSQMVRIIAADGGDVFKFAGDAMIVLWPECPQPGDMETTVRRAAQCAVAIQENLDKAVMEEGVQLSVKIGIGYGRVSVLHVGGVYGRVEYLAVGEPLIQAFHAEHSAVSGQVICSKEVWSMISQYFPAAHIFPDGYARIDLEAGAKIQLVRKSGKMNTLRNNMSDTDPILESRMKAYVAGAVLPNLNRDSPEDEQWGNELRRCTVMFVNLGMKEQHLLASAVYDEAMIQVHEVLMTVQKSVYQYEGSINKFLMDDKGSTLIACFGLPPVSHDDDPTRAVLAALLLCEGLFDLGLIASVGITTGEVFCGVVGSKTRREYTVLGDSVNLSARLMQKACTDGGGILCDVDTKNSSNGMLNFTTLDEIRVKGKSLPVKVFRPYHSSLTIASSKGRNIYRDIHKQQLQNAVVHKSLLALQSIFTLDVQPESRIVSVNSTSSASVNSMNLSSTSYSLNESISGRRQSSVLMDHMKGGPTTRTRKSAVRTSIASGGVGGIRGSDNLLSAVETIRHEQNHLTSSSSAAAGGGGGGAAAAAAANRRMSLTHKISSQKSLAKLSNMASFRSSSINDAIEINVLVPNNLMMNFTTADTLRPIFPREINNFQHLRQKILDICKSTHLFTTSDLLGITSQDVALNISGTRFFLPDSPIHIRWLSAYYLEAKSEFLDNWKFGNSIDLIVCLKSEIKRVQSRLSYAHCELITKKINLIDDDTHHPTHNPTHHHHHHKGSTIILEGEPGVGKTYLISQFIKNTLPNTCPIYYTPASPYSLEPFGPFNIFLQQYLDHKSFFHKDTSVTRTEILKDILKRGGGRLYLDGYLLDKYLFTNITDELLKDSKKLHASTSLTVGEEDDINNENNEILDDLTDLNDEITTPSQKLARRFALYYYLLYVIGCEERIILILDDAHTIDEESWTLILLISLAMERNKEEMERIFGIGSHLPNITDGYSSVPSIMFVISIRPLIKHRSIFRGSSPIYDALVTCTSVTFLKLDGLPPEEMEEFLLTKFSGNVTYMSDQVIQLIDQKCMSNPWMMSQLIDTLQASNTPILSFKTVTTLTEESLPTLDENEPTSSPSLLSHPSTHTSSPSFSSNTSLIQPSLSTHPKQKLSTLLSSSSSSSTHHQHNQHKTDNLLHEMQVDLVNDFIPDTCPLPIAVAKTYGTLFDRLTSCQQMILKTVAYMGRQFTWSYLYHCYPLEGHKYRLRKELQGLISLGYLIEIPNTKKQHISNTTNVILYDPTFHIISDFLLSLIFVRMLREQKDKIKMLIEKHQSDVETKQRKIFMMKTTSAAGNNYAPLKLGDLEVQKKVTTSAIKINIKRKLQGGDWKIRYCVVSPNTPTTPANLSMYRDRSHYETSPTTPTQIIYLQNAFSQIEPEYVKHEKDYVFRVDARQYIKDKSSQEENRSFLFAGKSLQEITDWVYMIKYTIELATDSNRISMSDSTEPEEVIALSENSKNNNNNTTMNILNGNELKLYIQILKVRNLIFPAVYSTNSSYLQIAIDKEIIRSKSTFEGRNDSSYDEVIECIITQKQWLRSSLVLTLKTVDLFLSPEVLGVVSIPLKDIILLQEEEIIHDFVDEGVWYSFKGRHLDQTVDPSSDPSSSLSTEPSSTEPSSSEPSPPESSSSVTSSSSPSSSPSSSSPLNYCNGEMNLTFRLELSKDLKDSLHIHNNDVQKLKEVIDHILIEEESQLHNNSNNSSSNTQTSTTTKSIAPRIMTLADILDYIKLSEEIPNSYQNGQSYETELKKIVDKKRHQTENIPQHFSKKLSVKIHQMLHLLNDNAKETEPTPTSGALNKMWICRHLREILHEFTNPTQQHQHSNSILYDFKEEDNLKNPYQHVIEQANTLDQQHLDWLASQYTKDSNSLIQNTTQNSQQGGGMQNVPGIVNLAREESIQKKVRRASFLRFESQTSLKRLSFLTPTTSDTKINQNYSTEPAIFDLTVSIENYYYCLDTQQQRHGPFSATQLYRWLIKNQIHLQLLVSHGQSGQGEYYPLAMFERTLRRVANSVISHWPNVGKNEKNIEISSTAGQPTSPHRTLPLPSPVTIQSGIFADPNHVIHNHYSWDFDVWDLEPHELLPLSMILMSSLGLSDGFEIDLIMWRNFMDVVQEYMTTHHNPYHNYYHISDVTQTCFIFISEFGGYELMRSYEILALLVSALTHDLDHPGVNNLYQVNARTPLAIQYNDISVLENHHCSLTFKIINRSQCQIFSNIDQLTYKSIRKLMISIILATDMTCHFTLKSDLDDLVKRKFHIDDTQQQQQMQLNDGKMSTMVLDDKEREVLLKAILHTADISNPAKLWKISKKWSDLVIEEFFSQGDQEKQEGLPVSPNMDRLTTHQDELSINFTDFIVAPFFFALTTIFPKLSEAVVNLERNRNEWHGKVLRRLQENSQLQNDLTVYDETVMKWEKRKGLFQETFQSVLEKALGQLERI